ACRCADCRAARISNTGSGSDFGQTKIQDFCGTSTRNKNISGFDVAMNDSLSVGGFERVRNLDSEVENFAQCYWLRGNAILQRFAFEELHGEKWLAIEISDFINGTNARVIQR